MDDPETVVDRVYGATFAGDLEQALMYCSADAQWHAVTPGTPWTGSHPMREYLGRILLEATGNVDEYEIETLERDVFDELVDARLRTTLGSGVMLFRVVEGRLTDVWAVNSKGREATGPF